jgi:hypothetical protein
MDIEFNGYTQPHQPTAYEELKTWYEKHSNLHKQMTIVPETKDYYLTIYIEDFCEEIIYFSFDARGNWYGTGTSTVEEMEYHIKCSEEEREKAL